MKYRHSASLDKIDFPAVKALGEPSHERTTQGACRLAWPILRGWGPRDPGSNPGWPTTITQLMQDIYVTTIRIFKSPPLSQ